MQPCQKADRPEVSIAVLLQILAEKAMKIKSNGTRTLLKKRERMIVERRKRQLVRIK